MSVSGQNFNIKKGDWVEVTSTENGFEGSWFIATVIEPPPNSRTSKGPALVMYEDLLDNAGCQLCEFVDPLYIRPIPRKGLDVDGFQANDVVEANYKDGWWVGVVIKLLETSRYEVYFESPSEVLQFHQNDLRLHRLWRDGKWIRPEKQVEHAEMNKKLKVSANADEHSCSFENPTDPLCRQPKKIRFVNKSHFNLSTPTRKVATSAVGGDWSSCQKRSSNRKLSHHKRSKEKEAASIFLESAYDTVKDETDVVEIDTSEVPIITEVEVKEGQDTYQQKETQNVESHNIGLQVDIASAHLCDNIADDQQEGNQQLVDQVTYQINKAGIDGSDHLLLEYLVDNDQQQSYDGAAKSNLSNEEIPVTNVEFSGTVEDVNETAVNLIGPETQAPVKCNTLFDDKLTTPFVKMSPLWNMVENFDVFKGTPQRPHFRPLLEKKQVFREGLAIGLMITFSNTCESIYDLVYDHPNKKFEQILESLDHLQTHGFNVLPERARVNLLLSLKRKHELLMSQVEDAEKEKSKKLSEKEKYVGDFQELERKRAELEKLIAESISKKEEKDMEVDRLQLYVDTINKKIQKTRHEFNVNVANASR